MKKLDIRDIARVVALRGTTRIDESHIAADPHGGWALFRGENIVLRYRYPIQLLYLYSECTIEAAIAAGHALKEPAITDVIYPETVERRIRYNKEVEWALRKTRSRTTTSEYLYMCLEETMTACRDELKQRDPNDFVDPRVEPDQRGEGVGSLVAHFVDHQSGPSLAVLVAEPGQGKTYVARRLAARLVLPGRTPIYVSSEQWRDFPPDSLSDIWMTLIRSFEHFNAPMPSLKGKERDFLTVTMKAGLFTLIFDGFDEYIYRNRGQVDAHQTIDALAELAEETDARILLTARTSFWHNEVLTNGEAAKLPGHAMYELRLFDSAHAKSYFVSRFENDTRRIDRSMQLYHSLRSSPEGNEFAGRGFILHLLGDLVQRATKLPTLPSSDSVTRSIMLALCVRECVRQELAIPPEKQIEAFGIFAEQTAAGAKPTSELLSLAISVSDSNLDEDEIRVLVGDDRKIKGKLADHPLIEQLPLTREWRIRQEQVNYNLLAAQLLGCTDASDPIMYDFARKILPDRKLRAEIATVLVDMACSVASDGDTVQRVREIIARLLTSSSGNIPVRVSMPERDLASTIAMLMVNRYTPVGRPREERRDALISYFPGQRLSDLQFSGTIASMSFHSVDFRQCRFDTVTWINCDFDKTTVFDRCRFLGGRLQSCEGFGFSTFVEPWPDSEAQLLIESNQLLAQRRPYSEADLKRDIGLLAQKFAMKGTHSTRIVESRYLRGPLASSPWQKQIIDAFLDHVLEPLDNSKRQPRLQVRDRAKTDVIFYVDNGVFGGALQSVFDDLAKDLV